MFSLIKMADEFMSDVDTKNKNFRYKINGDRTTFEKYLAVRGFIIKFFYKIGFKKECEELFEYNLRQVNESILELQKLEYEIGKQIEEEIKNR
jgi:hypothetical protein